MKQETELIAERRDGVLVLTLNRPERMNAMTRSMAVGVIECLEASAHDDGLLGVVITGSGRAFCAGGDLEMLREWQSLSAPDRQFRFREVQRVVRLLTEFPVPCVAAVNGAAAGAGFDLALAADLVVAGESARFSCAFTAVGLVPDLGGTWLLPRVVGTARARRLLFTNEAIGAGVALDWGIVSEVVPDGEVVDRAVDLVVQLVRTASLPALAEAKRSLLRTFGQDLPASLDGAAATQSLLMDTDEHRLRAGKLLAKPAGPEVRNVR